jgi:indole-3-glycerol phosphate synthase
MKFFPHLLRNSQQGMNRLEQILRVKRREIDQLRSRAQELNRCALDRTEFRSFNSVLRRADGNPAVIAEIKKASPSAGLIAKSFDPVAIAQKYEHGGADAISVLTDQRFFQGRLGYLAELRGAVSLPLLRKDFVLDEVQIAESVAAGADAILLIVAALEQKQLIKLSKAVQTYQLDVLIEVHTMAELDRALEADAKIVGINNRDLNTFEVDLAVTEELSKRVPDDVILVSESGIRNPDDLSRLKSCRIDAMLVGEALMRGEISIADLRRT